MTVAGLYCARLESSHYRPSTKVDYLYLVQQQHPTVSDSYFKFTVYGLRFAFQIMGLEDKHIELPSIKHEKKLPVLLSREEIKRLLKAPKLLKHRIPIGLQFLHAITSFSYYNICLVLTMVFFGRLVRIKFMRYG